MSRGSAVALFAFVAAIGAAVAGFGLKRRRTGLPEPVTGTFPNGMAYARQGRGPKTALVIPGGPGNEAPGGSSLRMFRSLIEDGYTVWNVTRKRAMPQGYTVDDIAED